VRLPDNPESGRGVVLGEGKPENQNHAMIFCFNEALQAIDMNQVRCKHRASLPLPGGGRVDGHTLRYRVQGGVRLPEAYACRRLTMKPTNHCLRCQGFHHSCHVMAALLEAHHDGASSASLA